MWPGKAYIDASEHARRRGASRQINYGWTRPQVISRGGNHASDGNRGYIAPAPSIPASSFTPVPSSDVISDPNGVIPLNAVPLNAVPLNAVPLNAVPLNAVPLQGPTEVQPYYQVPVNGVPMLNAPGAIDSQPLPTPAIPLSRQGHQQGSQIQDGGAVRQVNYDQSVVKLQASSKVQPVAVRRVATQATDQPIRDTMTTQGIKRIRATTKSRHSAVSVAEKRTHTITATAATKQSNNSNTVAPRSSNIDWERLGLTRPGRSSERTRARIKTN
jgi:hypothetical protein